MDVADDLHNIAERTSALCLQHCRCYLRSSFKSVYLGEPTIRDIPLIESEFRDVFFAGCIEFLHHFGWNWKNFIKAIQEIMVNINVHSGVRMDSILSLDLST